MIKCPRCNAITITGLPRPTPYNGYLCHSCGYRWGDQSYAKSIKAKQYSNKGVDNGK
jgi:transposase-like protein